jgi:hypothetical protein
VAAKKDSQEGVRNTDKWTIKIQKEGIKRQASRRNETGKWLEQDSKRRV